ncbi:MAG: MCE family protein [Sulfurospirillum sp.]|nr:MCE family protein [Sulfurospirillum sp.]
MEKRISYSVVGAFVLILSCALALFLFWMGKYGDSAKEFDLYKSFFKESVSGLNVQSSVKLKGVNIGSVKEIRINKQNSEEVMVLLEIIKDTPIKIDDIAVLGTQGITGLKYIEIQGGSKDAPRLVGTQNEIAIIGTKKSPLETLISSGESILQKADETFEKIHMLLNDKNSLHVEKILQNLEQTTTHLNANKEQFTNLIANVNFLALDMKKKLDIFSTDGKQFLQQSRIFEDKISQSFDVLAQAGVKVSSASDATRIFFQSMQSKLQSKEFDFSSIVDKNLEPFNATLFSLEQLSQSLHKISQSLEENPSSILYERQEKILGPGESHE